MTKLLFACALTLALAVLLVACGGGENSDATVPSPGATVSILQDGTPLASGTATTIDVVTQEVCQPNPDAATPEFQVIDQPGAGDTVTSPVTISGQVLAFEATYQVGIFDAEGTPIVETFGTAEGGEIGQLAPFSIDVPFDVAERTPACIWVYEASAMDDRPVHVGQIPVLLSP